MPQTCFIFYLTYQRRFMLTRCPLLMVSVLKICFLVTWHWVKSVRIRRFSGPYFPAFGLNMERYGIRTKYGLKVSPNAGKYGLEKLRTRTLFTQCESLLKNFIFFLFSWRNLYPAKVKAIFIRIKQKSCQKYLRKSMIWGSF